jgi:hypothetical protein
MAEDRASVLAKILQGTVRSKEYQHFSLELRRDREIALAAVRHVGGGMYAHVPLELQADREIALTAVQNAGHMLKHMPPELQADQELVERAVENNSAMLTHASSELKADRSFILGLLPRASQVKDVLRCAAPKIKKDREIAEAAVKYDHIGGGAIDKVAPSLRADKTFMLTAIRLNPYVIGAASAKLKRDPDVAHACLDATEKRRRATARLPDFDRLLQLRDEQLDTGCLQLLRGERLTPDRLNWEIAITRPANADEEYAQFVMEQRRNLSRRAYDKLRAECAGEPSPESRPRSRSRSRPRSE